MLSSRISRTVALRSVLGEVAESYGVGKLIVFAGSGVAEAAGLPSRADLVRRLSEHAAGIDFDEIRLDEISDFAQRAQWSDALAELREALGRNEFSHCLERFLDDSGTGIPDIARSIADMAPHLRAVFTTNMDRVLDRAFGGTWTSFAGVTRDIPQRRRYILKLRGMLGDRATWIVTRDDYDRARYDSQRFDVLSSLYHTSQILFICHDFADRDIERIIHRVGTSDSPQPPRHIALVPVGMELHERRSILAAAGIRVVELGTLDGGHAEICEFLRRVPEEARQYGRLPLATPSAGFGAADAEHGKAHGAGPDCPFPGLECFDESRAGYFFGRDAEVSAALQLLGNTPAGHKRWLFIDGASGVGKSSLVQAGILPKVRHGHLSGAYKDWISVIVRPGAEPVRNLAHAVQRALNIPLRHGTTLDEQEARFRASETALANCLRQCTPPDHGLLLIIDQLEETFTLPGDQERSTFDALLAGALSDKGGPLYLITTIRGDFTAHMAELPCLETLLNREASRFYLKAMSPPGLRSAIVEPARRAGLSWEPHLVDRILRDALDSEGSLPLVAHVLQALWLERDGDRLTYDAYERLGGVTGALTRCADSILDSLAPDEHELARALLLCMVSVGPRDACTRRPVSRGKALRAAGGGKRAERILARLSGGRDPGMPGDVKLARARLLTVTDHSNEHRVDLVHEAMLVRWTTLAAWLEENRKELLLHDDLKARLESWKRSGSSPRNLPSGAELEYLLAAMHVADNAERAFLSQASRKQSRARLWLRGLIVFLLLALVGVSWLAVYAFSRAREAEEKKVALQTASQELWHAKEDERRSLERAVEAEAKAEAARNKARAQDKRAVEAGRQADEAEQRMRQAEQRMRQAERRAGKARQQADWAKLRAERMRAKADQGQRQVEQARQQAKELEQKASVIKKRLTRRCRNLERQYQTGGALCRDLNNK